ncbi:MAG: DUF4981 domain-containing protein, partial [candidate division Zixibacteria bacterium]|nr:DUF4981 domain-containing protein [candidate division Zixibacteria bacterium]NIS44881.1 DUF4981 domain-containing protein [candidate division Zixibacteria bacterium]NIU12983.1 DUF4981 domain-containing protein [candidate division Zixibacteria bacterium]NIV05039.1 DUF4981 domain-containing protein [candidate division Zixibacteria bacterium]NIW43758.1 DUF4981 domain-containing protein [Gammaproteobacteria bacterium]
EPRWKVDINGKTVQSGSIQPLPIPPGGVHSMLVPFMRQVLPPGGEAHLMIEFVLREPTPWADAGTVVAWEQFQLPWESPGLPAVDPSKLHALNIEKADEEVVVIGEGFELTFNHQTGSLERWTANGQELLAAPLVPNLWRVPIDNDIASVVLFPWTRLVGRASQPWRGAADKRKLIGFEVEQVDRGQVLIATSWKVKHGREPFTAIYRIFGNGDVIVAVRFSARREMVRLGMSFQIPGEYSRMQWFGRGPHENMWDRKQSAWVGLHSGEVEDIIHDYVRPQENGARTDVRWAKFTNQNGKGLLVSDVGGTLLSMNFWPYTQEDLAEATHIHELPRREELMVNIDYRQNGVGGDVPSGSQPHPEFRLKADTLYQYSFRMCPLLEPREDVINYDWNVSVPQPAPDTNQNKLRKRFGRGALIAAGIGLVIGMIAWFNRMQARKDQ